MVIFETDRLFARHFNSGDLAEVFSLNGDEEAMRYIRSPLNQEESKQFLDENISFYTENPKYGRWALIEKKANVFIGSFMLRPSPIITGKIELGYALLKPYWGRGFATESVKDGLIYGFQRLELPVIIAITHPENIASQNVLLKSKFIPQGNILESGRTVNLFQIRNPRRIETNRLIIIPLSADELELYLRTKGIFEKKMELRDTGRIVSPEIKERVQNEIIPKMKAARDDHYLFYTFWIVVEKMTKTIVAELGFKGEPGARSEIEIGYGTLPQFRDQGYMSEAVEGMIQWAKDRPGIQIIMAEIEETNIASIRIVQNNQFQLIEQKKNMLWWSIELKTPSF